MATGAHVDKTRGREARDRGTPWFEKGEHTKVVAGEGSEVGRGDVVRVEVKGTNHHTRLLGPTGDKVKVAGSIRRQVR